MEHKSNKFRENSVRSFEYTKKLIVIVVDLKTSAALNNVPRFHSSESTIALPNIVQQSIFDYGNPVRLKAAG